MKKILLSALTAGVLFAGTAHAQDPAGGKTFFTISAGAAIPMGTYGSTDIADFEANEPSSFDEKLEVESIGAAKTGINLDMSIGHFFIDYVGAGVKFGVMYNAIDGNQDIYSGFAFTRPAKDRLRYEGGDIVTVSPEAWIHATALPTLFFDYPVMDNLNITAEAGVGVALTIFPELREEKESGLVVTTHEVTPTAGLAYTFGLGVRYAISESAGLKLSGNYMAFNSTYTEFNGNRTTNDFEIQHTLPVRLLNLNLGFEFRF